MVPSEIIFLVVFFEGGYQWHEMRPQTSIISSSVGVRSQPSSWRVGGGAWRNLTSSPQLLLGETALTWLKNVVP